MQSPEEKKKRKRNNGHRKLKAQLNEFKLYLGVNSDAPGVSVKSGGKK